MHDLVRAYALQAGGFGRRLDEVEIGVVEIEDATSLIVGLLPNPITTKQVPFSEAESGGVGIFFSSESRY